MKERILVISDIHGCYDEFIELLQISKYNPDNDQLILLGDYVDRGEDSKRVIEKVISLVNDGAVALRGNHDDWFLCFLSDPKIMGNYLSEGVGGFNTLISYLGLDNLRNKKSMDQVIQEIRDIYDSHIQFILNLPYYYETENYIYVHAGISPYLSNWRNNADILSWIRWDFINNPTNDSRKVVFGHTACRTIHNEDDIWYSIDKIAIDGGCCFGGQLNCLEIIGDRLNQYHVKKINCQGLDTTMSMPDTF